MKFRMKVATCVAAASLGLAGSASSTKIAEPPISFPIETCGVVVFDEICGTLFQADNGAHYGFGGLEDYAIGTVLHIEGEICLTCLLMQCGSPWSALLSVEISECGVTGDLTGDGIVNGIDMGILLANWSIPAGAPGCGGAADCDSDLNGDTYVNGIDLGILLSNWTV